MLSSPPELPGWSLTQIWDGVEEGEEEICKHLRRNKKEGFFLCLGGKKWWIFASEARSLVGGEPGCGGHSLTGGRTLRNTHPLPPFAAGNEN